MDKKTYSKSYMNCEDKQFLMSGIQVFLLVCWVVKLVWDVLFVCFALFLWFFLLFVCFKFCLSFVLSPNWKKRQLSPMHIQVLENCGVVIQQYGPFLKRKSSSIYFSSPIYSVLQKYEPAIYLQLP